MDFVNYIRSSNPLIQVNTYEEFRVLAKFVGSLSKIILKDGSNSEAYQSYVWSLHGGVRPVKIENNKMAIGKDPIEGTTASDEVPIIPAIMNTLKWLETAPDNTILFLRDFHPFLTTGCSGAVPIIAKIRDLIRPCNATNKALVFISPNMQIPPELEKDVTPVDFKLPDKTELLTVLRGVCQSTSAKMPVEMDVDILLDAALGMTSAEAENALVLSLVEAKKFDANIVRREKAIIVKKSKILEVIETSESLDTIGGLEIAKEWTLTQKDCFTSEAKTFGVRPPKGVLLLGVAGCGKSLLSKAIATAFNRPLLRLDMSNIMDKWVGGSETKMKLCLDTAEAVAPCVLWIDEVEKGLAGNSGGGQEGHEVTRRVFGMLLTWLVEKKADVILVATANSISSLPPELISRFSTSFWVDLPDSVQRKEIIKIHLKKNGRKETLFTDAQLNSIVQLTQHYNGREIENAIIDSIARAWNKRHPNIQVEDLIEAVKAISPINLVKKAEVDALRTQAKNMGTKPASISHDEPASATSGRKVNVDGVAG
ncbi:MAG: AAA family ATPase [Planctomycetes bacterium]|nr:AAA family ATPase [Planctomycetota bacterium]